MSGPLTGIRILELGGIGPAPMCGMVLADLGADVIRIDRAGKPLNPVLHRNRRSIALDLKDGAGIAEALAIVEHSDAVIEGFRPGVIERLGLGPDALWAANPRLIIGRMTGWGQEGPWAQSPGHDMNYIASVGVLHAIGTREDPIVPLNLIGDFGGGGMLLAVGVLAGILEARESGEGQVVDAAMIDGASMLNAMTLGFLAAGRWTDQRADNRLDGAAPYYSVYRCEDGHMAVGCVEPQFWQEFLEATGLAGDELFLEQERRERWSQMKARIAKIMLTRTRAAWSEIFPDGRACVSPVLSMGEAAHAAHNTARGTFASMGNGFVWPSPAPRFSRTRPDAPRPAPRVGEHTAEVLSELSVKAGAHD